MQRPFIPSVQSESCVQSPAMSALPGPRSWGHSTSWRRWSVGTGLRPPPDPPEAVVAASPPLDPPGAVVAASPPLDPPKPMAATSSPTVLEAASVRTSPPLDPPEASVTAPPQPAMEPAKKRSGTSHAFILFILAPRFVQCRQNPSSGSNVTLSAGANCRSSVLLAFIVVVVRPIAQCTAGVFHRHVGLASGIPNGRSRLPPKAFAAIFGMLRARRAESGPPHASELKRPCRSCSCAAGPGTTCPA